MKLPVLNLARSELGMDVTLREAMCMASREAESRAWSCSECIHLGSESDGGEPEYAKSWPVCRMFPRYEYLKTFPFKRAPSSCFELDFFSSAFVLAADLGVSDPWSDPAFVEWTESDRYGRPGVIDALHMDRMAWESPAGGVA